MAQKECLAEDDYLKLVSTNPCSGFTNWGNTMNDEDNAEENADSLENHRDLAANIINKNHSNDTGSSTKPCTSQFPTKLAWGSPEMVKKEDCENKRNNTLKTGAWSPGTEECINIQSESQTVSKFFECQTPKSQQIAHSPPTLENEATSVNNDFSKERQGNESTEKASTKRSHLSLKASKVGHQDSVSHEESYLAELSSTKKKSKVLSAMSKAFGAQGKLYAKATSSVSKFLSSKNSGDGKTGKKIDDSKKQDEKHLLASQEKQNERGEFTEKSRKVSAQQNSRCNKNQVNMVSEPASQEMKTRNLTEMFAASSVRNRTP